MHSEHITSAETTNTHIHRKTNISNEIRRKWIANGWLTAERIEMQEQ